MILDFNNGLNSFTNIYAYFSPRSTYKPKTLNPKQYEDLFGMLKGHKGELPVMKFKEDQISWKDEEGNTLLHLAAWRGEVNTARCIFNSIKARKLTSVQNKKGVSPLAMAIISGQVVDQRN